MEGSFTIISIPQMSGRLCDLRGLPGPQIPPTFSSRDCMNRSLPRASLLVPSGRSTEPSGMTHKRALKSTSLAIHMVDEAPRPGTGGPGPLSSAGLAGKPPPDSHSSAHCAGSHSCCCLFSSGGRIFPGDENLSFFLPLPSLSCSQSSFLCLCMSLSDSACLSLSVSVSLS